MKNIVNVLEKFMYNLIHPTKLYKLKCGSHEIQGHRDYMEDQKKIVKIRLDNIHTCYLLLLCDGHAGGKCSEYVTRILPKLIQTTLKKISSSEKSHDINKLLTKIVLKIDKHYVKLNDFSGTTCVFALFINNLIHIVNIGDSRCIIGDTQQNVKLATHDHKPGSPKELKRIYANGGGITNIDTPRVYINQYAAGLAISRVLGDVHYKGKNIVIANPDIYVRTKLDKDEFIILASDGLWDVVTNKEAIQFVNDRLNIKCFKTIAKELVEYAFLKGSGDNISVIVCKLE